MNCELRAVFTKLAKLHVKQSFSFAIVLGDLFGDCSTEKQLDEISALLQGNISVPLPTYFTLGNRPLPTRVVEKIEADDEVCPNLYFLGKRGTLKTAEGVRIVALGGRLEGAETHSKPESNASGRFQPTYTESDARALFGTHSADILVTNQWPKGIRTGSKVLIPDGSALPVEAQCVADVCSTLKPRYHASPSDGFFYEREPFFHMPTEDNPDIKPLTRFIGMASYPSKQKWMYAFTLDPNAPPPLTVPPGATTSPLSAAQTKRKTLLGQHESFQRFAAPDDHQNRTRKRARAPPPGPDQCFFCLSNPNIATHLITSIGNESYLTTAKGPLPTADTFPSLGFPGHMLIIPFSHTPTLNMISEPESRSATYKEMQRYRGSLHKMIAARSAGTLGAVTWEVSRAQGIHVHWQFLPVPADLISRGLVEAAFKVEAENLSYPRFEAAASAEKDGSIEPGDFFRVWIWSPPPGSASASASESGEDKNNTLADNPERQQQQQPSPPKTEKALLLSLSPDFRFDLQFGRRVMAKLLELDKRMNWKDDVQSLDAEEADATAFKVAFKMYDFSLE